MRTRARHLCLLALSLALLLLVAACGEAGTGEPGADEGEDQAAPDEAEMPEFEEGTTMARLQQEGSMTVGTKFDQPLFGLQNPATGEVEGFDVEIAKLMAEGIYGEGGGDRIEFVEAVSANREPFIQNDQVDMVVATYTINDERKQVVDFAGPYYVAGQDIMVPTETEDIQGIDDLNDKRVCSVEGSTSIQNLEEMAPGADVIAFDSYSRCAEAMSDGRVDAVTTDNVILLGLIEQYGGEARLVDNPFTEEPYGIGMKKGDDEFREFLNTRIEEICASGEWAEAWESTAGAVAETTPECPEVDRY